MPYIHQSNLFSKQLCQVDNTLTHLHRWGNRHQVVTYLVQDHTTHKLLIQNLNPHLFNIKASTLGPSREQRSKMWRSTSSPQIHQKYIYMWNNSYRTPTECWQKPSDFPKGKKLPTYLAVWLTGSWCTGRVPGLCLWGGRAEFRTLVHQRPPGPT